MRFTEQRQYEILLALGYSYEAISNFTELDEEKPEMLITRVTNWLDELNAIDAQIASARGRVMVNKVEETEVDYSRQISAIRLRGREIVKQISMSIGIPVHWNRFGGSKGSNAVISVM